MRKIGVEIEVESTKNSYHHTRTALRHNPWWVTETETSLRGPYGWEVRTADGGLPLDVAVASLDSLYAVFAGSTGTWRAAVHVHVDATDYTWPQRALALCLAYLYDQPLFERFSPERVESNFCSPLATKSELVADSILAMLNYNPGTEELIRYGKYSSVNSNSLFRYGTFEFRHMQTPAASNDVSSVQQALRKVADFATEVHNIIDNPVIGWNAINDGDGEKLLSLLDIAVSSATYPYSQEAFLDVMTWLGGYNKVLPGTADRAGIISCLPGNNVTARLRQRVFRDYVDGIVPLRDEFWTEAVEDSVRR
jgi:hypothetical protein